VHGPWCRDGADRFPMSGYPPRQGMSQLSFMHPPTIHPCQMLSQPTKGLPSQVQTPPRCPKVTPTARTSCIFDSRRHCPSIASFANSAEARQWNLMHARRSRIGIIRCVHTAMSQRTPADKGRCEQLSSHCESQCQAHDMCCVGATGHIT
jgi:hypothetical protein